MWTTALGEEKPRPSARYSQSSVLAAAPHPRRAANRGGVETLLVEGERREDHVHRNERPALEFGRAPVAAHLPQRERAQAQRAGVDRREREGQRRREREGDQHEQREQERRDLRDRVFDDRDREVRAALRGEDEA